MGQGYLVSLQMEKSCFTKNSLNQTVGMGFGGLIYFFKASLSIVLSSGIGARSSPVTSHFREISMWLMGLIM